MAAAEFELDLQNVDGWVSVLDHPDGTARLIIELFAPIIEERGIKEGQFVKIRILKGDDVDGPI